MRFNASFDNFSVISWRSVLLVEETGVPGDNHRPAISHWPTLSYNVRGGSRDSADGGGAQLWSPQSPPWIRHWMLFRLHFGWAGFEPYFHSCLLVLIMSVSGFIIFPLCIIIQFRNALILLNFKSKLNTLIKEINR